MAKIEKQILSLISQLNRAALLRIMQAIIEQLQSDDREMEITPEQWDRMDKSIKDFEAGKLATLNREEMQARVKALRKK